MIDIIYYLYLRSSIILLYVLYKDYKFQRHDFNLVYNTISLLTNK